jgi:hypothetical protein
LDLYYFGNKVFIIKEEFEDTKRLNQNPSIEEEQTTQRTQEKVQKDKQQSTKHNIIHL